MKKKIVHLITHDKFTAGYINFMKMYMKDYNHIFMVSVYSHSKGESIDGKIIDFDNVIKYESGKDLAFGKIIRKILEQADKIIVSGIFGIEQLIFFWPNRIFKKVYLHYWGSDFYQMREKIPFNDIMGNVKRYQLKSCFKRAKGFIFLIDGEYTEYKKITGILKERVYIAAMPLDPNRLFPFEKFREKNTRDYIRIVVGNSATIENKHIEVFELLKHIKHEKIEIYCPLSYGNQEYGEEVAEVGKKIFGEKFNPIYNWMNLNDYYHFLSSCDIGIFGNDRQQGMGNIAALLRMGKKVYLRAGTSMFDEYKRVGFKCFDLETLKCDTFENITSFPEKELNEKIADNWNTPLSIRKQWINVFEA